MANLNLFGIYAFVGLATVGLFSMFAKAQGISFLSTIPAIIVVVILAIAFRSP